jgi:hypothetical protein
MVQGEGVEISIELVERRKKRRLQLFEVMPLLSQNIFLVRIRLVRDEG